MRMADTSLCNSIILTMASTWLMLALVPLAAYILQAIWFTIRKKKNGRRLPPGPRGLPILGHLHMLGKFPHRDLHRLAKKYGPIMYTRFGFVSNIVVSSPEAAKQFLKTHDHVFAGRPIIQALKYVTYGQRDLIFAEHGPYWRSMRKLCTLELFSSAKINSFMSMRREEVGILIKSIKEAAAAQDGGGVDLSAKVSSMNAEMICRMMFGKKYTDEDFDERGFKAMMEEGMELAVTPNIADYFPYVGALDLQGLDKRFKALSEVFDQFFEKIIDDHLRARDQGQTKDFVDIILAHMGSEEAEYPMDRSRVKALMVDLLVAGMDTSATTIEWALSELLKHPRVTKKVQKELEEVVGMDRLVEESDLESLKYFDMVMKEAFRLHPVAPLLLPHESTEDCTVDGFHIPKKSRITINAWAIGRDPNTWTDPEKFFPERFAGSSIDVKGLGYQLLPFGSGRRSCPGMQLGLTIVRLVVAQLVHCFDWKLPNNMLPTQLQLQNNYICRVDMFM
ncbi:cytochrome P450 71AU50-like [Cornus florida]|uniref:cytochrome P450 71AU50-like n=1 Tax=Cornus florida TaxID=4283 RepID=UPI0028A1F4EB|nr:cytochrome P450 71AU50-like [Cornus florida]